MDFRGGQLIHSICLLLAPSERPYYMHFNMPPLAIGILQGYLREQKYKVNSIDLNISLMRKTHLIEKERCLVLYQKNIVLDYLLHGNSPGGLEDLIGELVEHIDVNTADIVGISMGANFSFFEIHSSLLIGKYIQDRWKKPVVYGGDNLQYLWQFQGEFAELWKAIQHNFKYLFIGPGERSLARLVEWLNNPENKTPYHQLPGAIRFVDGQIIYNPQDLPSLVRPDFQGLELKEYSVCLNISEPRLESMQLNLTHYYKWPFPNTLVASETNRKRLPQRDQKETIFIPYIFNYNCPFACAFCVQSREDKPKIASKDALSVVNDLETLSKEYQTSFFYFFNNTFNYTPGFTKEFCRLVIERGLEIYWSDCARFNNLTKDLVALLYQAGCRKLVFGFETGSEKLLKLIDKRLDLEHAQNVLTWCQETGIWVELEIIVGLPHENEADFQATFSFIEKAIKQKQICGFQLNKYFVVPVSLIARYPEKYGIELIKIQGSYEKLVIKSGEIFFKTTNARNEKVAQANFQVYRFNETNGRSFREIVKETETKAGRMQKLYLKTDTFNEVMIYRYMEMVSSGQKTAN